MLIYLVGHDDKSDVGRTAFVKGHRIGNVESHLTVPLADFCQILPLQLEQVQRDIGASPFLESDGSRQSDKFHLLSLSVVPKQEEKQSISNTDKTNTKLFLHVWNQMAINNER